MPLIIHDPESMPMTSSMYSDTVVLRMLFSMLVSIDFHFTLQQPIPNDMQTAVADSRAICDGPSRALLPKVLMVTASSAMSVSNGIALSHADGVFNSLFVIAYYANSVQRYYFLCK